jgi:hypothetical protein
MDQKKESIGKIRNQQKKFYNEQHLIQLKEIIERIHLNFNRSHVKLK